MTIALTLLVVVLSLPAVFVLAVLGVSIARYGFTYTLRAAVYQDSGIADLDIFPTRAILNQAPVFHFEQAATQQTPDFVYSFKDRSARVGHLEAFLAARGTVAFLVVQDDRIRYERFFDGYQRDTPISVLSVSKSITSTLIGLAITEGYINSVDDRLIRYLPELEGRGLDELAIRNLLVMDTCIPYIQDDEAFFLFQIFQDDALNYYLPDLRQFALGMRAGQDRIGEAFLYNNHYPLFEGLILERVTGQSVSAFAERTLWKRLGMEFPASWNLDSTASGFEHMESGFNARAIDFLKFGRLFLGQGKWNGQQIVPEAWVQEATCPDPADSRPWSSDPYWPELGGYYKYHWWGLRKPGAAYVYAARGHHGQVIYINPERQIIIFRAGKYGDSAEWTLIADALAEVLD
jgi:CubicO group peptidase (beta-lactamase class C family)